MRLNDLIGAAASPVGDPARMGDIEILDVTADSRAVKPGSLFVAIPGGKRDGHDFVGAAIAAGAAAILVRRDYRLMVSVPSDRAMIAAENPRRALAEIAARFWPHQPKIIAAVTGTSGKTSTAVFTRQIWAALGHRAASLGTIGLIGPDFAEPDSLTTPDPVELHRALSELAARDIDHLAIEASSHGLDQHRLDGVALAAAAFTNLSRDHLDYHSSMEAYFAAKMRLFAELLPAGGTAVINADSEMAERAIAIARARRQRILLFGREAKADIRLRRQNPSGSGQSLDIDILGRAYTASFAVAGLFQAENLLAALGLVIGSGEDPAKAAASIERLAGVRGRIECVATTPNGAGIYVDYAHKPAGLAAILTALRPHARGRLVVLFGCGGDRDRGKRPEMGEIATRLADRVIVTDDNPRSEDPATIRAAILAAAPGAEEIGDRATAIRQTIAELAPGDLLVIAGKGHETYQIIGERKYPFDDAEIAREAVAALRPQRRAGGAR